MQKAALLTRDVMGLLLFFLLFFSLLLPSLCLPLALRPALEHELVPARKENVPFIGSVSGSVSAG